MDSLFSYKTLQTRLEPSTRTLFISIHDPENFNDLSVEMLFELESILSWCSTKVEIHSIVIESSSEYFSRGLNPEALKEQKQESLEKIFEKVHKLNLAIMHLPQTVIFDIAGGAQGLASELTVGADIRIASENCELEFNHTQLGLIPCSGGIGFLTSIVNPAMAKNWILSGEIIPLKQLTESGFIYRTYNPENRSEILNNILAGIKKQAPVQRIQAKLGLLETIREKCEASMEFEKKLVKAALIAQDWKNNTENNDDFIKAKNLSYSVKLTLVNNDSEQFDGTLPDNVTPIN